MITDGSGRDEVLLPIYLNITISEDASHSHRASKVNIVFTCINLSFLKGQKFGTFSTLLKFFIWFSAVTCCCYGGYMEGCDWLAKQQ